MDPRVAAARFRGIKAAYEILGNPARRRAYDLTELPILMEKRKKKKNQGVGDIMGDMDHFLDARQQRAQKRKAEQTKKEKEEKRRRSRRSRTERAVEKMLKRVQEAQQLDLSRYDDVPMEYKALLG
mmetsp:Transcript_33394/g.53689  ORF Transcript_33394/g.53689 Transcript_33394/m.53689 type:complete len:126 (-) Transcript_33394:244-621(-)